MPVLPTQPVYNPFAVNKTAHGRHLHTVEVAGSNPAAPTIESMIYAFILWCLVALGSKGAAPLLDPPPFCSSAYIDPAIS